MKGKILKERGITLIALVITIIVLLILAGVTLSIVLHTGIIDNSQKAVDTYQAKAEDEVKQMDDLALKIQMQFGILDNTEGEANKTITGSEEFKYNNPVIPVGFKTSNEGASWKSSDGETVDGWNSGLVIEDKDGNQFVWVPCYIEDKENDELVEYKKTLGKSHEDMRLKEENFEEILTDELPIGITNEKSQIEKYGGFYIARYEAGIPAIKDANGTNVDGIPTSKKNQVPWNGIDYTQAKANAEKMYNNENVDEKVKSKVKSGLVTGTMWDTTLQWLLKTEAVTNKELNEDSSNWGNYRTSTIPGVTSYSLNAESEWIEKMGKKFGSTEDKSDYKWLLKTGNTEYTKRNNIYDLAGNLWEWTTEVFDTEHDSYRIRRSGSFEALRLRNSNIIPLSYSC